MFYRVFEHGRDFKMSYQKDSVKSHSIGTDSTNREPNVSIVDTKGKSSNTVAEQIIKNADISKDSERIVDALVNNANICMSNSTAQGMKLNVFL